ncbi:hypothetical protein PIB30_029952 [Stylosanthes scabra]|uniref:Peptidase M16C associated domain-containing protein n=1 Tax=Stylosanthes scabra TaxID=79078 RepID=A0ABU6WB55_9FABA|nr:hypothetical protein [Stylosanthes scabra]
MTTLEKLSNEGFDMGAVEASMNTIEFSLRENNAGSFPRGLSLMLRSISKWIYDMNPFEPLKYEKPLQDLKSRLAKEGSKVVLSPLIEKFILNNPHRVTVEILLMKIFPCQPDPEKVARDEATEKEILQKVKSGMIKEDLAELTQATHDLRLKQETPDPPEALKAFPSLSLQDIPKEPIYVPIEVGDINGVKVLQHDLFTNDVLYTELVFDMSSLKQELLPFVPLFCELAVEGIWERRVCGGRLLVQKKRSMNSSLFGFVRYKIRDEVGRAVLRLNGWWANERLEEKLERSLVREAINPIQVDEVRRAIMKDWCEVVEVKMLGSFKVLITFDSKECMETIANSSFLLNHFVEVRSWSPGEGNTSRKAWIEVYGLPLHTWTLVSMAKVEEVWRNVIKVEENEDNQYNFFKVLIETGFDSMIQARMKVEVKGMDFLLYVKEMNGTKMISTLQREEGDDKEANVTVHTANERERNSPIVAVIDGGAVQEGTTDEGDGRMATGVRNEASNQKDSNANGSGSEHHVIEAHIENWKDGSNSLEGSPTRTKTWDDDRITEEII